MIDGFDGTNAVGVSYDTAGGPNHGYSPDMGILDYPGANSTLLTGIDGTMIVGTYWNADRVNHGLLYDGDLFYPIDFPGATATYIEDISGNKIVGSYYDGSGLHGFVATIVPEPSSIALSISGLIGLWAYQRKKL